MDARQFLAEFGYIASAPGGVLRLREMVLSLAYQGNLCPHSDENTEALLVSIETQRVQHSRGNRVRTTHSSSSKAVLFKIPSHWRWPSLGEVGHSWGQKTPTEDFTYIDVSSIDNQRGKLSELPNVLAASNAPSRARKVVRKGDVIYSTVRPYLLNVAIIDRDFDHEPIASTAFAVVHTWDGVLPRFVYLYLRSPYFVAYVQSAQIGMAYPAISDEKFYSGLIPLPPTSEQERIVAKVDELMALCDRLETQQQHKAAMSSATRASALESLATAPDAAVLESAWRRFCTSLHLWLDDAEAIGQLRNTLGFLACKGLLSEPHALVGISDENSLMPLPAGWTWVTLEQLAEYITSGSRGWKQYMAPQGDIFIRSQDIKKDRLLFEDHAFVKLPEKAEGKRTLVRAGDLLMTITGANVGKCAVVPPLVQDAYVSQHVALIRVRNVRHTPYVHAWLINAFGGRRSLARHIYGDKPGLNLAQVGGIPIPLPPQDVQDRIVAKAVHFMAICDSLESQISHARETAEALATTAVAAITGIHIEDKEDMKAPKTELVSRLRLGVSLADKDQAPLAALLIRNQGELAAKALWRASGLEIDDFYRQLKTEMARGWIVEPEPAYMREVAAS